MFSSYKTILKNILQLNNITRIGKVNKNTKERGALWQKEECFLKG